MALIYQLKSSASVKTNSITKPPIHVLWTRHPTVARFVSQANFVKLHSAPLLVLAYNSCGASATLMIKNWLEGMFMRKLFLLTLLLLFSFMGSSPISQAQFCGFVASGQVTGGTFQSIDLNVFPNSLLYVRVRALTDGADYRVKVTDHPTKSGTLDLGVDEGAVDLLFPYTTKTTANVNIRNLSGGLNYAIEVRCGTTGIPLNDGRITNYNTEAAIYATDDGIFIYRIAPDSSGLLVIALDRATLDRLPATPNRNLTIATSADRYIGVYKLTTGQYQVNVGPDKDGKVFVTRWVGLPPTEIENTEFFVSPR